MKLIAHDVQALVGDQMFSCGLVMHMNVCEDDDQQCFHQLQAFRDVMWHSLVKPSCHKVHIVDNQKEFDCRYVWRSLYMQALFDST